jgi:hypothetical protein
MDEPRLSTRLLRAMKGQERMARLALVEDVLGGLEHGDNGDGLLGDDRCFASAIMEWTRG